MLYNINIVKSKRKTFSLEIKPDLEIICRAPLGASEKEINTFIDNHKQWLEKNIKKAEQRAAQAAHTLILSDAEINLLKAQAKAYIPKRVEFFANQMGIEYGSVTVRMQKTRWGSCSSKGNLSFNCLLMLTSDYITDYVIVHELCHIKEMNHSKKFWSQVENVLPDYRKRRDELKETGAQIMMRAGII